jgi:hypothetical protein
MIRDGVPPSQKDRDEKNTPAPPTQGNGQPVIGGNVTAINGSTLTMTNKSNTSYTIDATNAKIEKKGTVSSLSNIVIGENVVIQGTINGTAIVASSIIDYGITPASPTNTTTTTPSNDKIKPAPGFKGAIGGFFHRLFGFF